MTKFLQPSFSINVGGKDYADGWDRIFGPKDPAPRELTSQQIDELLRGLKQIYEPEEKVPVSLSNYQKRQQAWAEYNFPLKANTEHHRMACEFFTRLGIDVDLDAVDDLAHLLASRDHRSYRPLLGVVEEVGELCHAHLKNEQGIRGTPEEWEAKKKDAIGDILIYLLDYATREGVDVEECLETAWAEVSARDWVRFPKNGRTE